MSKDIVIINNGTGAEETWQAIDETETRGIGSGAVEWVPEDEYTGMELTVMDNGTYAASDYGAYAFTRVIAMVQSSTIRGYIDGVLYDISVDEDGYLVFTPVEE